MTENIFSKPERKTIFELFLTNTKLKFTDIQKALDIRSNHLAYHLKIMIEANILEKKNDYYSITSDAQKYIPLFSNLSGEKLSPLPVALVALMNEDKILMIKRKNRPYKGYWSLIGGRILHDETHREASLRLIKKKASIENTEFVKLCDIADEKVYDKNKIHHAFILFFTKVITKETDFIETTYGKLKWIKREELKDYKIIPSDLWLLENSIEKKMNTKKVEMKSCSEQITNFYIK